MALLGATMIPLITSTAPQVLFKDKLYYDEMNQKEKKILERLRLDKDAFSRINGVHINGRVSVICRYGAYLLDEIIPYLTFVLHQINNKYTTLSEEPAGTEGYIIHNIGDISELSRLYILPQKDNFVIGLYGVPNGGITKIPHNLKINRNDAPLPYILNKETRPMQWIRF